MQPYLFFGTNPTSGQHLYIPYFQILEKNFLIQVLPGGGKTRFELNLAKQLIELEDPAIVVFDMKGDLDTGLTTYITDHGLWNRTQHFSLEDASHFQRAPGVNL